MSRKLSLILTPHGRLLVEECDDAAVLAEDVAERIERAFARNAGHGLLQLGAAEVETALPPVFVYWREFSSRYIVFLRTLAEVY
jgi:hypothetical protein